MTTVPIRVSPDDPHPTHHLRLKGAGKDIGLILVDSQGRPDPYAISRDRLQPTSLKINEGNPKYSDFELPFTPLSQEDYSGGRGQERYEDDLTRFLDSWNINTSFANKVILGPQMQLTSGTRDTLLYDVNGDVHWATIGGSKRTYLARRFSVANDCQIGSRSFLIKKSGNPSGELYCRLIHLFDDTPDSYDTQAISTTLLKSSEVNDITGDWRKIEYIKDANTNYTDDPRMAKADCSEWSVSGGTLEKDAGKSVWGNQSMKVTATSNNCYFWDISNWNTDKHDDVDYLFFAIYIYIPTGINPENVRIQYFTDRGSGWQEDSSRYMSEDFDTWRRPIFFGNHYYEDLQKFWIRISMVNEIGKSIWVDGALLMDRKYSNHQYAYFDGACGDGYSWTGTENASTSLRAAGADLPLTSKYPYCWEFVSSSTLTQGNCWFVGCRHSGDSPSDIAWEAGPPGNLYVKSYYESYYIAEDSPNTPDRVWQFQCKGATYTLFDWDNANPKLYLSSDRGTADANTGNLGRLNDGSKSWEANQKTDCIAYLTGGKGSTEDQPWRLIVSNGTNYLTVSPNWKIEHDTTTEYAILGANEWQEITGVLPTGDITDVFVHNGVIYIARGDAAPIRRIEFYTNAGTWSSRTYDDTTYKADLLCVVQHSDEVIKKIQMWRLIQSTQNISRADIPAWGSNFSFGTEIRVGDIEDKAVKLIQYVDPAFGNKCLWVIKRGSTWAVKNDIPDMIQLPEMQTVASENTGRAVLVHNLFLYWSMFQGGIERFYQDVVDDVGPNRDRGFEVTRSGIVWDLEGYPGRFFLAINGGMDKYSCILMQNGQGYHELFRSFAIGQQIKGLHAVVIPGSAPNRLYFTEDNTIKWLPLPSETMDPEKDPNYLYTHEGCVISSRLHAGMMDIVKLYDSIKIMADGLEEDICWIEVDYKVDDEDSSWTPLPNKFEVSPSQEINFVKGNDDGVTGKYALVRIRLHTKDCTRTPKMRASLVNSISRIPTKFGYVAQVKLESISKDLNGDPDDYYENGLKKIEDLDELGDNLSVLTMSSILSPFHNKRVFIDAPQLRPLYHGDGGTLEGFTGLIPITVVYRAETTR
jgi:hypothetical protein